MCVSAEEVGKESQDVMFAGDAASACEDFEAVFMSKEARFRGYSCRESLCLL